ncbi:MAG: DHH family phosphoesterase [Clostridiales bacterium]|nr:DHH family phosphoesterase [Clostridiales bacterium]
MEEDRDNALKYLIVLAAAGIVGAVVDEIFGIIIVAAASIVVMAAYTKSRAYKNVEAVDEEPTDEDEEPEVVVRNDIPVPYAVIDEGFNIIGCNEEFLQLIGSKTFTSYNIKEKLPLYNEHLNNQIVKIGERDYRIYSSHAELNDGTIANSLCFMDVTEIQTLKNSIENDRTVVGLIYIDNYDEVIESIDDLAIPMFTAIVDRKLTALIHDARGILKKTEKDRYFFCITYEALLDIQKNKFDILNEIRSITIGEHIPVTLSIGIGIGEVSLEAAMKSAKAAIDLALGRGGDQALIKNGDKYIFYGGKSGEVSHNARIRARVKADALSELIAESERVYVMGHKIADADCFGSSMGIYRIAKSLGKSCSIILDGIPSTIKKMTDKFADNPDYDDLIVNSQDAWQSITENTLLIIVDTHINSRVESVDVLNRASKVVVFDHHRKSTDFIDKAVMVYHEPYASSACELVTEMIQYIGEKVRLKSAEADALLAGITVDTQNFSMKTGTITFEAAAFLKRCGADGIRVRKLLQEDLSVFKAKAQAVAGTELISDGMYMAVCPSDYGNSAVTAAQAADELLDVEGIKASFVLCDSDGTIFVSARSLGEINVQVILEKIGGGGHQTISGAQFKDKTVDEVKEIVKEAVRQYIEEAN